MATYYTDNAARDFSGKKALSGQFQQIVAIDESYEAVALASGSTIRMVRPPVGYKFAGIGFLQWDDLSDGGTVTVSVGKGAELDGTVADVDAFLAATSTEDAADWMQLDSAGLIGYEFDGGTWITLTTAGAATSTGTIRLVMFFLAP